MDAQEEVRNLDFRRIFLFGGETEMVERAIAVTNVKGDFNIESITESKMELAIEIYFQDRGTSFVGNVTRSRPTIVKYALTELRGRTRTENVE